MKRGGHCLFYLGYNSNDEIACFTKPTCQLSDAASIYQDLIRDQDHDDPRKVWLLLDGYRYGKIDAGLHPYKLLATSQEVDIKSQEFEMVQCLLLPCWKRDDLFGLGEKIHGFDVEEMDRRFFYSGGNVHLFGLDTIEKIKTYMDVALGKVAGAPPLFSNEANVQIGENEADCLRRTFIQFMETDPGEEEYYYCGYWVHVIDSTYVAKKLVNRLRTDVVMRVFHFAQRAGYGSLAGALFEAYVRILADNDDEWKLLGTKYDQGKRRSKDSVRFKLEELELKNGKQLCAGNADDYVDALTEFRDNATYTSWLPDCQNFPNIDGIVKLKTGNVAYLQIISAKTPKIDGKQLEVMNGVFFPAEVKRDSDTSAVAEGRPLYVAVCPDLATFRAFKLESRPEAVAARKTCSVYKSYCSNKSGAFFNLH
ncbi:hypothetical protein PHYBOEH_001547 [Phytophthora boehmeriae]|uniref:Crinkler (CRN) family protein n=1 Tax=Phytophthora boehmeriae TaxID=109152 RepID=A0A8T1V7Y4_9STRA|nr:hypothetical protein PHYBOEH_001547 [Phytophthora boehmeriae]